MLREWGSDASGAVAGGLRAAWELVFPLGCAGCGFPGVLWCAACRAETAGHLTVRSARPDPEPPGFPPTWVATSYDGAVRHALSAYKDDDRRDLVTELGALLARPLRRAVDPCTYGDDREAIRGADGAGTAPALVVPVPSSRQALRRRGDAPLIALARVGCAGAGIDPRLLSPGALTPTRRLADQAGLSHAARAANLRGAFRASAPLDGLVVVLVDDVVTTGATLAESARALYEAGAAEVRAACIAATVRRVPPRGAT